MTSVVVGTAGHIDHGKSALVRALTGIDPDRLKEEKARGITIDLGFAHTDIDGLHVAFVDVPGHERFVKNMLAGAGGIDLVLLVVAADESVMPQTREHFDICRLLHVHTGVIALTKMDLVDADTRELAALEVRELVAGSFLESAPIVPVSAKTGEGLDALRSAIRAAAASAHERPAGGPARLPIDRVFSMKGFGTVVTGTLVSGRIAADEELVLLPGDRRVTVRGVQVHGAKVAAAVAGQRTAINLAGVEVAEVSRGQNLAAPGAFESTRVFDAVVDVLPAIGSLKHGARVRVHQGTAEIIGRIAIVGPPTGNGPPDERVRLPAGSRGYARVRLEQPAVIARGDRYILRAYSPPATIAGGYVLDPEPPRRAIRTADAVARLERLDFDPDDEPGRAAADGRASAALVEEAGASGLPVSALATRVGVAPARADATIQTLETRRVAIRAGTVLVAPAIVDHLEASIVDALRAHHAAQPLSDGLPREEARERLFRRGHPAVFERAVDDLASRGTIVARDRLALATHRVELTPEEARARAAIDEAFDRAGLAPPDPSAVASSAKLPKAVADRMIGLLQRQKVLVKVDTLFFHERPLKELKEAVAGLKENGGNARLDVAAFKERFGVSRKFAIPLLEYLDRERITRRVGDARVIL